MVALRKEIYFAATRRSAENRLEAAFRAAVCPTRAINTCYAKAAQTCHSLGLQDAAARPVIAAICVARIIYAA